MGRWGESTGRRRETEGHLLPFRAPDKLLMHGWWLREGCPCGLSAWGSLLRAVRAGLWPHVHQQQWLEASGHPARCKPHPPGPAHFLLSSLTPVNR